MSSIARSSFRDYTSQLMHARKFTPRASEASAAQVSTDQSVSAEAPKRVGGAVENQRAGMGDYLYLMNGQQSPTLGQIMGAEPSEEEATSMPPLLGEETDTEAEGAEGAVKKEEEESDPSAEKSVSGEALSKEESAEVQKLKARDREVRAHEQAHVAAGGQYIRGGISYDYQKGPDGRSYAVGGQVDIDISEESTPEATINKMRVVKRAALAPAEPSGADRAVAAAASSKEQQARSELADQRQEEAVERRKEASSEQKVSSKEGASSKEGTSSNEGVSSGERSAAAPRSEATPSPAPTDAASAPSAPRAPEPPRAPEGHAPRTPEMMNLARESRMRIMRGAYWLA